MTARPTPCGSWGARLVSVNTSEVAILPVGSDQTVFVVDYPGSNSLQDHAKTFSNCGAMNNLLIVILEFQGDLNDTISREITKIYKTMRISPSKSSPVIICLNQCERDKAREYFEEYFGEEGNKTLENLRREIAEQLNKHCRKDKDSARVESDLIRFTD